MITIILLNIFYSKQIQFALSKSSVLKTNKSLWQRRFFSALHPNTDLRHIKPDWVLDGYALNSNFSDLTHSEFILKYATIADYMEAHAIFNVVPEHVSGFASYREMSQQYKGI